MSALARYGYWVAVAILSLAALILGGFIVVRIAIPELQNAGYLGLGVAPSPTKLVPSPSPVASGFPMGNVVLPANADCAGCHQTNSGAIGLKPIPVMGHPLEGWSQCTACHAQSSLVKTAPGHTGIHADQCLLCHKPGPALAPLSRPHRALQNVACLSCHGSKAPLPADMTHRSQNVCWLCHRLPDVPPPIPAHQTAAGETDCLTCHVAGKVGALPPDHTKRTASECLLCHEVTLGSPTPGSAGSAIPGVASFAPSAAFGGGGSSPP